SLPRKATWIITKSWMFDSRSMRRRALHRRAAGACRRHGYGNDDHLPEQPPDRALRRPVLVLGSAALGMLGGGAGDAPRSGLHAAGGGVRHAHRPDGRGVRDERAHQLVRGRAAPRALSDSRLAFFGRVEQFCSGTCDPDRARHRALVPGARPAAERAVARRHDDRAGPRTMLVVRSLSRTGAMDGRYWTVTVSVVRFAVADAAPRSSMAPWVGVVGEAGEPG